MFCRTEQETLRSKLQSLETKILVGGENLLEKAQTQEELLEKTIGELEKQEKNEQELKESLQKKEVIPSILIISKHFLKTILTFRLNELMSKNDTHRYKMNVLEKRKNYIVLCKC